LFPWLNGFSLTALDCIPFANNNNNNNNRKRFERFCGDLQNDADQLKDLAIYYLRYSQEAREKLTAMKMLTKYAVLCWCYESSQKISRMFLRHGKFLAFRIQRSSR